jgi:hypothetical protein
MTQYVHFVSTLYAQILLVDKKAAIAPIKITNDKKKDMMAERSEIPRHFMKIGKWLMMKGGCWVFNEKDSNIYDCFWLKSMVPVGRMVTRVLFEFSRLGGSKLYKKQNSSDGN